MTEQDDIKKILFKNLHLETSLKQSTPTPTPSKSEAETDYERHVRVEANRLLAVKAFSFQPFAEKKGIVFIRQLSLSVDRCYLHNDIVQRHDCSYLAAPVPGSIKAIIFWFLKLRV